jgi:hypothetical protein
MGRLPTVRFQGLLFQPECPLRVESGHILLRTSSPFEGTVSHVQRATRSSKMDPPQTSVSDDCARAGAYHGVVV